MSIYEFMKNKSAEEAESVVPEAVLDSVIGTDADIEDKMSPEEEEEILSSDDHEDNLDAIEETDDEISEYESLEHFALATSKVAEVLTNLAGEEITYAVADSINAHITSIESFVTMNGGPDLGMRKFSQEDFNEESTPETRAVIVAASAEDFKAKAKAAVAKTIDFFIKIYKKMEEVLIRLFSSAAKLKARAEAAATKASTKYVTANGEVSTSKHLCVNGTFDAKVAVKSYRDNVKTVLKHADIRNATDGDMVAMVAKLFKKYDPLTAESLNKRFSEKQGKAADDAKIIAHLGGLNIGLGGGMLYVEEPAFKSAKTKALVQGDIKAICTQVIADYDVVNECKASIEAIGKVMADLKSKVDSMAAGAASEEAGNKATPFCVKLVTRAHAKAGSVAINRMGGACYTTSVEALRLCEWSMSGKEAKAEKK